MKGVGGGGRWSKGEFSKGCVEVNFADLQTLGQRSISTNDLFPHPVIIKINTEDSRIELNYVCLSYLEKNSITMATKMILHLSFRKIFL